MTYHQVSRIKEVVNVLGADRLRCGAIGAEGEPGPVAVGILLGTDLLGEQVELCFTFYLPEELDDFIGSMRSMRATVWPSPGPGR